MPPENKQSPFPDRESADKNQGTTGTPVWERNTLTERLLRYTLRVVYLLAIAVVACAISSVLPERNRPALLDSKELQREPFGRSRLLVGSHLQGSDASQQLRQRHATGAYWKVAVAELHPYRFFFVEDPNEPAGQFYRRLIRNLETKVQAARTHSTENVDEILVTMVTRHLAQDDETLRLLRRVGELAEARGFLDSPKSVEQQTAEAAQLAADLTDDPGRLDQIEDPESRALVEALYQMDVMRIEQLREIELMQVRLQERHLLTSFALPSPPE